MRRYAFPRSHRLKGRRAFSAVFEPRVRTSRGPLGASAIPNGLGWTRLGISIGRHVGTAVARNRIKRLLREAFRLSREDLPCGYDLAVVVRPHRPLTLAAYRELLTTLLSKLHAVWQERRGA